MPWPFSRKNKEVDPSPAPSGPLGPRAADADDSLIKEILRWLTDHTPSVPARRQDDAPVILLGEPPRHIALKDAVSPPAGAVLKVKRGKLSWVDLYDPELRQPVNDLVKVLDRQQKWSFNGVISTKYRESPKNP